MKVNRRGYLDIELSELTIRILFLFLPGILASTIIDTLTNHRKRNPLHFFINSYLLGMSSYLLLSFFVWIINKTVILIGITISWETTFMSALFDSQKEINLIEVFSSTAIGFIIALLIVIIIQKRYLYRLAIFLKLSNKHGDDDLWEYFFNIEEVDWIIVRDTNTKLIYQGAVIAYSQKDDKRELILSDVIVFSEGVEKLYEMSIIYFNFDINSNIIIEFDERNEINEGEKDNHNTRET